MSLDSTANQPPPGADILFGSDVAIPAVDGDWRCPTHAGPPLAPHRLGADDYRRIFDDAPVGLFQISPAGRLLRVNRVMARICGYAGPEQLLAELFGRAEQWLVDPAFWSSSVLSMKAGDRRDGLETELRQRDGKLKWVRINLSAVPGSGGSVLCYEGSAEDISERRNTEERVQWLAYYDTLTGLPNRPHFRQKLEEALSAAQQNGDRVGVLLLEIDRFKIVNDSTGEKCGDRLLQEAAQRLRTCLGNAGTVARMAGAEFGIILPAIGGREPAMHLAHRLIAAMGAEFSFLGHSLNVACNIGISIFPEDGLGADALLKRADLAMYSAQERGPDEVRYFTEEMNLEVLERLKLENGLRVALERNELFLEYQPQVDTRTGIVSGLEALLRWQHPQLGLVPPSKFISIAERSGLIVPIGEWVLRTACAQAKRWQDAGLRPVPVAVNVSAFQFRRRGFRDLVRRILEETRLDARFLELELTEGVLLTDADVMFSIVQELREMGVKLAIDDFGTGYSSLGYLRQFKVSRLKIDRTFVRDVPGSVDDSAITTAIIRMAKALNLEVLAEGVETAEQMAFLRDQHCYEIQGYYFSRPVPVDQVVHHLQASFLPHPEILRPH